MANGFGRNFLLLQGPHGPFFRQLGQLLEQTGAAAWRVGFNGGDAFFWDNKARFIAHTESLETWPAALRKIIAEKSITDIVLYGDTRPVHAEAITCLGLPFYSGWGLTHDRHEVPRRQARPDILGLIHACLIEYPRYFDPMSKLPCPPEVVVERLAAAADLPQACYLRPLAKIQGVFASQAHLWRNMR